MTARDRLVESMQALLWERGYAAASPRVVLDRARVGQGSMYHHFAGKEALARAAFERSADTLVDRAARVLRGEGGAVERVCAYLGLARDALRGCPVGRMAADAQVLESAVLHDVLARTFARVRELLVEVIADGVRQGELRADIEPAEVADSVLAVVQGGYVLARACGDRAPFDRAVRGAIALLELARGETGR
jgi:AcrR family transcriptional regulator